MRTLKDEFMRAGFKEINLPARPEEGALVLQDEGSTYLAMVNGVSHRLGEKEARKHIAFLTKFLEKFDNA